MLLSVDEQICRPAINPAGERIGARARLSPDGKCIAYSVVPTDGATGYATDRFGSIHVARIDGTVISSFQALLRQYSWDGPPMGVTSSSLDDLGTDHLWAIFPFQEGQSAGRRSVSRRPRAQ